MGYNDSFSSQPGPFGPPTNFTGLAVNGVPIVSSGGAPFFTGRWIFCDAINGSDGNQGYANSPVQTLGQAYSLATAGKNDVIVIVSDGTSNSSQRLSSTLVWAKNATHLIGMSANTIMGQRARISTATGQTTNINPLMQITASDCYFSNFSFFQGVGQAATDEKLCEVTGLRNFFGNIQFGGMGHANGAARAGSWILKLTGAEENTFAGCVIGLETIQRSAANASVVVSSGAHRNSFLGCYFMMAASATSPLFVDLSEASCLNGGSMLFQNCTFTNLVNISGAQVPTAAFSLNAAVNGTVFVDRSTTNAGKWAAATAQLVVSGFAAGNGFSSGQYTAAANS